MKNYLLILAITTFSLQAIHAQNVGIGTTEPKAKLDVAGDLILRSADLILADGNTHDLDVNSNKLNHYRLIGPTSNFQIGGIQAAEHDRIVTLYNRAGSSLEVYNEDIFSIDSNRILTGTGGTFAIYPGGNVSLKYDNNINRWEIISSHYNSLDNFGSGNWALSGDDIYNGNVGKVGIGTSTPSSKLTINGNIALLSDTILSLCSTVIPPSINNKLIINNITKQRSVFHVMKDTSCDMTLSPQILGINGGSDGQIVTIIFHMDNCFIIHLLGLNGSPTTMDSLNMIELFEPNGNGNINQPQQITFNTGGAVTLIYDGNRNRWKPINYYGEVKNDLVGWYKGPNQNDIYNPNSGNVGIGTGLPSEKLEVNGNLEISGEIKPNGISGSAGKVLTNNGNGTMMWSSQTDWPISGNDIKNSNTGNVGIGSFPSPGFKLDVSGNGRFSGSTISSIQDNGCISSNTFSATAIRTMILDGQRIQSLGGAGNIFPYNPSPKDIYLNPLGGNIGINTTTNITSPLSFPNVVGKKISLWSAGTNNEYGLGIQSGEMQIYTAGQDMISFGWGSSNNFTKTMSFFPGSSSLNLYNSSGISTISLNADYIDGDGRIITQEIQINGGSDLSENFDIVNEEIDAIKDGMLVSIDSQNEGKLTITQGENDRKVAGVISGANGIKTGMLMGQSGSEADGEYPIALVGRVFVLATDEDGEILPGDFLTSSKKKGYAKKVKNYTKSQGSIIGKAMGKLDKSTGYVLVLINLQ